MELYRLYVKDGELEDAKRIKDHVDRVLASRAKFAASRAKLEK